MHIIKTTPQSFLKKLIRFGIEESLQNSSLNQRGLLVNILPFFYTDFMRKAFYLQKLQALLLQKYADAQITVLLRENLDISIDGFKQYLYIEKRGIYNWEVVYWRLFVFVEKSETEYIWLYVPQYVLIPTIKSVQLPGNVDLKIVIDQARANLSLAVEQVFRFTKRSGYVNNNNIKVIPVKIAPLIVDYLKKEKDVPEKTLDDILFQFTSKNIQQIVSSLKDRSEDFIEIIVSYHFDKIKNDIADVLLPGESEVLRSFLHSRKQMIDRVVDNVLDKIIIKMKDQIEGMSLKELEYYNNEKTIYSELLKIRNHVNIPMDDIKNNLIEFIYKTYKIKKQIENITSEHEFKKEVAWFTSRIDKNISDAFSYFEKDPFMKDILGKIEVQKKIAADLYDLFVNSSPPFYSVALEKWKSKPFSLILENFLKIYGWEEERFNAEIVLRVKEKLESFFETKMQKIVEKVIIELIEEIRESIRINFFPQMIEEIKAFIENRLKEKSE